MRCKRLNSLLAPCRWVGGMLLLVLAASSALGSELDPAKVPLALLQSWASRKMEWQEMADRATGKIKPEPVATPTVTTPEKTNEPVKPEVKGQWTRSRPGQRRENPPHCALLKNILTKLYRVEHSKIRDDAVIAYDFYRRFGEHDLAFATALKLRQLAMRRKPRNDKGDNEQKLWQAAILATPNTNWAMMDAVVADWDYKLATWNKLKAGKDPNWTEHGHFKRTDDYRKKRLDYYHKDAKNIKKIVKDLDFKGDEDPELLWQLCLRYGDSRPYIPIAYITALYRLREWYPDRPEVKRGDVQWRLVTTLGTWADQARGASRTPQHKSTHWKELYEYVGIEAEYHISTWPESSQVRYGDALWASAEAHRKQGDETIYTDVMPVWKEARDKYLEFQKTKKKHHHNRIHPKIGTSECMRKLGELNARIR